MSVVLVYGGTMIKLKKHELVQYKNEYFKELEKRQNLEYKLVEVYRLIHEFCKIDLSEHPKAQKALRDYMKNGTIG